jgi:hypothetical protein
MVKDRMFVGVGDLMFSTSVKKIRGENERE